MRKYEKERLHYDRIEMYIKQTYYKVAVLIPQALQDWGMNQTRHSRSLRLELSTSRAVESVILDALDQGEEYLRMLCGPDGLVTRQDQKVGDLLISVYSVTLQNRPDLADDWPTDMRGSRWGRDRFDLTLYDQKTNEILDDFGVIVLYRVLYFNYGHELLRIRQSYPRGDWPSKIEEVRARDPYTALDPEILDRLDKVFLPEI